MIESLHRLGSRMRHSPALQGQTWLWNSVEPLWNRIFERASKHSGYAAHINEDLFRLSYSYAARYDRADNRTYEPVFYKAFADRIREGMTVFDIGAHVGFFTLAAARRVGTRGHVYSFEPNPTTANILESHIRMNGWEQRVDVERRLVSDISACLPFYTLGASMASSLLCQNVENAVRLEPTGLQMARIEVPSLTIDSFCQEHDLRPDILKIDVEGAELKVLSGARRLLSESRLVILCEVHPSLLEASGSSATQLEDFISSLDYTTTRLDEPNSMGIFHLEIKR